MQHPAWRVNPAGANTYRFRNVMRWAAGQVRIQQPNDADDLIVIPGPIADDTEFEQNLKPGQYEISWHRMVGQPDVRVRVTFEVPFDDQLVISDPDT